MGYALFWLFIIAFVAILITGGILFYRDVIKKS